MFKNNTDCPSGAVPYVIRKGDTLIRIVKQYNSTVEDILNANQQIDPNNLQIGKRICVPLKVQLYPSCPTTNYYVVNKNDNLQKIANYFNVTYEQLYYANFGIDPTNLYEDQVLCIPVAPSPVNIIINLTDALINLYQDTNLMRTYPIIKRENATPKGEYIVINKKVDPGAINGARWLGLSLAGLGIHGTIIPPFIKQVATDKSITTTNEAINELFNLVPVGTNVLIKGD